MFDSIKKAFSKKGKDKPNEIDKQKRLEEFNRFQGEKEKALEAILGPMHNLVKHALIPFYLGGHTDLYFFQIRSMGRH